MPFYPPFNLPFFNNYRYFYNKSMHLMNNTLNNANLNNSQNSGISKEKVSEYDENSEAFFEILGLKLYFDDILIICILFFLYTENVQNEGLFICLIMLLLT